MAKLKLSNIAKTVQTTITKHSPEILIGIGIAGMFTTTVMAVKATPKALKLIENKKEELGLEPDESLTAVETIKTAWKPYIPAAITGILSTTCIIGANTVNARRNAALATAYSISETALKEYQDKVIETVGEKKEKVIRDAVAKEKIEKDPVKNHEVIITNKGEMLCYDALSGRYFKSDIEKIKSAVNELNSRLMSEMYISLNEFYYELGLSSNRLGEDLGWNLNRGLIDISFSSQLAEDGTPCLVMNYRTEPRYDYGSLS